MKTPNLHKSANKKRCGLEQTPRKCYTHRHLFDETYLFPGNYGLSRGSRGLKIHVCTHPSQNSELGVVASFNRRLTDFKIRGT